MCLIVSFWWLLLIFFFFLNVHICSIYLKPCPCSWKICVGPLSCHASLSIRIWTCLFVLWQKCYPESFDRSDDLRCLWEACQCSARTLLTAIWAPLKSFVPHRSCNILWLCSPCKWGVLPSSFRQTNSGWNSPLPRLGNDRICYWICGLFCY